MNRRFRIVVLNGTCLDVVDRHRAAIEARGVDLVAKDALRHLTPDHVDTALADADALVLPAAITQVCGEAALRRHRSIKTLSIAASGFDWLDIEATVRQGVVVTNAPIPELSQTVAAMAMGLMLAVTRQIPLHDHQIRRGDCQRGMGVSVHGKTMGIIGLGAIGREVALLAEVFGMKLVATEPCPDAAFVEAHNVRLASLDDLLQHSDIVSLHARLDDDTCEMIGQEQLKMMKPTAYLINTARRKLVDEAALADGIANGWIAGAGLDDPPTQPDSPLLQCDNVVFATHLGVRTVECADALFDTAIDNALMVLHGRRPEHVINPQVYKNADLRAALASTV